jgi:hypothetical protein
VVKPKINHPQYYQIAWDFNHAQMVCYHFFGTPAIVSGAILMHPDYAVGFILTLGA